MALRLALCLLIAAVFIQPAYAQTVLIHDGDTLTIEGIKIRLWGIDAPELGQYCQKNGTNVPCGKMAKIVLQTFIGNTGNIVCKVIDIDQYKRKVARCKVDDADIGGMMVLAGYALAYRKYSGDFYLEEEKEARIEKRGLWGMNFREPWDWRKNH
ncbi:MAG: thermonuclease family protein [Rhodospirillales bacterium]|nr:thermonuclease family protein [Alphaproteobacteria bacterium]MCB9987512.1 thermonuclease family protein [Rhodospirillales bacterium]USO07514.1 MAG: thermonuclease family protein [Rhodospirillales bacterium]